jgi:prefoldin subunit 5|tara:strand:- start:152 stop:265 length:114 start_codon:yes stop_codon:yes gene_type:complete
MRYNFKSSQDEALHFLHLRIKKLVEENKKLKEKLNGQ